MPFNSMLRNSLTPDEHFAWESMLSRRARSIDRGSDLIREGDTPHLLYVVLDGWAQKYKQLPDGRRQIVALFLPGDICDLDAFLVDRVDHCVAAVRNLTVAELSRDDIRQLVGDCPSLAKLFCWNEFMSIAIQREWTINVGQRNALERIAHLLCEIYVRFRSGARMVSKTCEFLLTQCQIAEATGLTQVHVNRTLQNLRSRGMVDIRHRELDMYDFEKLAETGQFNSRYLHTEEYDSGVRRLAALLGMDGEPGPRMSRSALSPQLAASTH